MITLMVVLVSIAAYLYATLYAARSLYGRWRANSIDYTRRELRLSYPTTADAIKRWNNSDRGVAIAGAIFVAVFWPVTVPLWVAGRYICRFMDATPVLSESEHRDRRNALDDRIRQLEKENGILRREMS